jgi:adenylate cyclase
VWDHIRDKLPYGFKDMGEQSVKNIARPVRVYAMDADAIASLPSVSPVPEMASGSSNANKKFLLVAACIVAAIGIAVAGVWWQWPRKAAPTTAVPSPAATQSRSSAANAIAGATSPRLSVVVLPFTNLSSDPDQEYFADGITDDLTTDLSQISDSFVIARNTRHLNTKAKPSTRRRSPASWASAMCSKEACAGWMTKSKLMCNWSMVKPAHMCGQIGSRPSGETSP